MPLEPGLRGGADLVVGESDTAVAFGSGSVPVLATPRVIALCEAATVAALEGHLEAGVTSVGIRVQIDHLQPTPLGIAVEAEAVLEKVQGRRLTFAVNAKDPRGLIAAGKVTRAMVDTERFLQRATQPGD